jgi:hypothetical protein
MEIVLQDAIAEQVLQLLHLLGLQQTLGNANQVIIVLQEQEIQFSVIQEPLIQPLVVLLQQRAQHVLLENIALSLH